MEPIPLIPLIYLFTSWQINVTFFLYIQARPSLLFGAALSLFFLAIQLKWFFITGTREKKELSEKQSHFKRFR